MNALESLSFFLPELFLILGIFITIFLDLWMHHKVLLASWAGVVLCGYLFLISGQAQGYGLDIFFGCFTIDGLTFFARLFVPIVTLLTLVMSIAYKPLDDRFKGEFFTLLLFLALALVLMAGATNLLMIFISIEFVSLLSYLLTGFLPHHDRAREAAIKYFLFGSAASAMMLYGMSLLFGISGVLELSLIQQTVASTSMHSLAVLGLVFFLAGLGFKISMAPFHMWAPDVYEAAPTPITAFLTVAPKAMGFVVLIRILGTAFQALMPKWQPILIILSMLTMTLGNVTAIAQTNIKRLIAFSSIAQAGYILMGLAVFGPLGIQSVLIYLVVYALTNLGAFAVIILVSNHTGSDEISAYAGLAKRSPALAAALVVFLLSLAGIPPLAGFIGKLFVFLSALHAQFYILLVVAVLNSALAAYYYFRIIKAMYLASPEETPSETIVNRTSLSFVLGVTLSGVLLLGLMPQPIIAWTQHLLW